MEFKRLTQSRKEHEDSEKILLSHLPLHVLHALHGRKKRVHLVGSQPGDKQHKIPLMPGALGMLPQASRAANSKPAPCRPAFEAIALET